MPWAYQDMINTKKSRGRGKRRSLINGSVDVYAYSAELHNPYISGLNEEFRH
jgi:hypothetical protein